MAAARERPGRWLVKTEPDVFSFDDLRAAKGRRTSWDGVRNYQARNFLRDGMRVGDGVLVYHSGGTAPAVVGIAEVARAAYPDPTQFDPSDSHHDPKARAEAPTWVAVDLRAVQAFAQPVPLADIKANPALAEMVLVQRGSRLSVQPVTEEQWGEILRMGSGGRNRSSKVRKRG